jgi:hypothetical protein
MKILHKYERIIVDKDITDEEKISLLDEGWEFENYNFFEDLIFMKEIERS